MLQVGRMALGAEGARVTGGQRNTVSEQLSATGRSVCRALRCSPSPAHVTAASVPSPESWSHFSSIYPALTTRAWPGHTGPLSQRGCSERLGNSGLCRVSRDPGANVFEGAHLRPASCHAPAVGMDEGPKLREPLSVKAAHCACLQGCPEVSGSKPLVSACPAQGLAQERRPTSARPRLTPPHPEVAWRRHAVSSVLETMCFQD